jgi:tetratricopeptide (TPR) repeat protein
MAGIALFSLFGGAMTRRKLRKLIVAFVIAVGAARPSSAQVADEPSRREAIQHYRNGQELFQSEKLEAAAVEFQRAIDKDHLLTLAYYSLGQSFMNLRRYAGAIKAYQDCIAAFRTLHGLTQVNRIDVEKQRDDEIRELRDTARRLRPQASPGSILEMRAIQIESRVDDLERQRTSVEGPFVPPGEVLLALGSAMFRSGNREGAEAEWKAALQSKPKLGEAHNNLAVIYLTSGRYKEAEAEVKAAEKTGFRVNPQFKEDLKKAAAGR